MTTLTELQAHDVAIRWLLIHIESMGNPPLRELLDCMHYQYMQNGEPLTWDPGEWSEWKACVTATLEATAEERIKMLRDSYPSQ